MYLEENEIGSIDSHNSSYSSWAGLRLLDWIGDHWKDLKMHCWELPLTFCTHSLFHHPSPGPRPTCHQSLALIFPIQTKAYYWLVHYFILPEVTSQLLLSIPLLFRMHLSEPVPPHSKPPFKGNTTSLIPAHTNKYYSA